MNQHGFLLVNKPADITSTQVLRKLKRIYPGKIGHTGTLDPMATGMLVVALGDATKFAQYQLKADKSYTACIALGYCTDSDDRTGKILAQAEVGPLNVSNITAVLAQSFTGKIEQIPPKYSALKYQGKPYYWYARNEKSIPIPTREVTIHNYSKISYCAIKKHITCTINCGSGTYIRALARDIGIKLGTLATLESLHRNSVAPWQPQQMQTLAELINANNFSEHIEGIDQTLTNYPDLTLTTTDLENLQHGRQCTTTASSIDDGIVKVYTKDLVFRGLAAKNQTTLRPVKILRTSPKSQ